MIFCLNQALLLGICSTWAPKWDQVVVHSWPHNLISSDRHFNFSQSLQSNTSLDYHTMRKAKCLLIIVTTNRTHFSRDSYIIHYFAELETDLGYLLHSFPNSQWMKFHPDDPKVWGDWEVTVGIWWISLSKCY